ncbi:dethiobiotin synthetase [Mucilaginibacter gracilis]|uniref:ATP-dependent dethiobiotin synthetase BioD n=1 Tax=Mucilaginibacter gracilis TaxID=423350 RepID=A0A495J674_9SPHI|nr:dethiobiotin synthase [Mucilaginibacter gracilis]RKR83918.1 dethiobiotin synthetase [Mucilaginibacter gracilis]
MNKPIFITGIGTGIGKTIVSAIVVEKLKADYWKPIQAGDLDNSDTLLVKSLVSNTVSVFHPETYRLTQPYSPHKSAQLDGLVINMTQIIAPQTKNQLIIEGAGGLMVPLNNSFFMIDLIKQLDAEVILVSKNYLGSINHTLLSIDALKHKGIPVKGIIFNGDADESTQTVILNYSNAPLLCNLPQMPVVNKASISSITHAINF